MDDKARIQAAIKRGSVAPEDIPITARPLDWSQTVSSSAPTASTFSSQAAPSSSAATMSGTPNSSQNIVAGQKRSADSSFSAQNTSTAGSSQPQVIEIDDDSDDEFGGNSPFDATAKDDLYVTFTTSVSTLLRVLRRAN